MSSQWAIKSSERFGHRIFSYFTVVPDWKTEVRLFLVILISFLFQSSYYPGFNTSPGMTNSQFLPPQDGHPMCGYGGFSLPTFPSSPPIFYRPTYVPIYQTPPGYSRYLGYTIYQAFQLYSGAAKGFRAVYHRGQLSYLPLVPMSN